MAGSLKNIDQNNDLIVYQGNDGAIQLRSDVRNQTIWATQKQIGQIFSVNTPAINKHIKNILEDGELSDSTISILEIVQQEGSRQVTRKVEHYNLDILISVGYRVNSKTATKFRQWAISTLKQHITEGYTVNQQVLSEKGIQAQLVIDNIKHLAQGSTQIKADDVLELISSFAHTWFSLQSYDEGQLPSKGKYEQVLNIDANDLYESLATLKSELKHKGEATDLFAQEKTEGKLNGIVGSVMQSVFGQDAYPSIEEKAANLLYFIIKNHPFNDGNKRSGAFSFIWFLQQANFPVNTYFNPNTLTAITLLIAESDAKKKEQMVGLVLQLMTRKY